MNPTRIPTDPEQRVAFVERSMRRRMTDAERSDVRLAVPTYPKDFDDLLTPEERGTYASKAEARRASAQKALRVSKPQEPSETMVRQPPLRTVQGWTKAHGAAPRGIAVLACDHTATLRAAVGDALALGASRVPCVLCPLETVTEDFAYDPRHYPRSA